MKQPFTINKAILALSSGKVLSQVISVLALGILSRLYTPSDYGELAIFISLTTIFAVFATLKYENAIFLPKTHKAAMQTVMLCMALAVSISILLFFFLFFLNHFSLFSTLNPLWTVYLPLSIFLQSTTTVFLNWENRKERYGFLSKISIIQALAITVSQAFFYTLSQGLVLGYLLGKTIVVFVQLIAFVARDFKVRDIALKEIKTAMKKYRRFPMFSTATGLLMLLRSEAPILLLTTFFGDRITGLYAMARKVCFIPMRFVGSATGQVFFRQAAKVRDNRDKLAHLLVSVQNKLVLMGTLPLLIVFVFAEPLFLLALGSQWGGAAPIAQIMVVWCLAAFMIAPLSHLFSVLEKQKLELIYYSLTFLISIAVFLLSMAYFKTHIATLWAFSIANALLWNVYLCLCFRYFNIPILKRYTMFFVLCLGVLLGLYTIRYIVF